MQITKRELKEIILTVIEESNNEGGSVNYKAKLVKTYKGGSYESPEWALVLKPETRGGDIIVIPKYVFYEESNGNYYPNFKFWGGMNTGSQEKTNKVTPFIKESLLNNLISYANNEGGVGQADFDDEKLIFKAGTTLAAIKSQL